MSDIIDELSQAAAAYAKALKAIQFKVNPTKNELAEIEKCKGSVAFAVSIQKHR